MAVRRISLKQSRQRRTSVKPRQAYLSFGLEGLTPRERQVFDCRVRGLPFKLVADELHMSMGTAKQHANRLYRKLGVNSSLELSSLLLKRR